MHKKYMRAADYLIIDENKIIKDLEWNAGSFLTCPQTRYGLKLVENSNFSIEEIRRIYDVCSIEFAILYVKDFAKYGELTYERLLKGEEFNYYKLVRTEDYYNILNTLWPEQAVKFIITELPMIKYLKNKGYDIKLKRYVEFLTRNIKYGKINENIKLMKEKVELYKSYPDLYWDENTGLD
jgi:hypothetical protein